jgi:hypothetical protein
MTNAPWTALAMAIAVFVSPAFALPPVHPPSPMARAESLYADWLDAAGALATVDSGLVAEFAGRGHRAWAARLRELTAELDFALTAVDAAALTPREAAALKAIRRGRSDNAPDLPGTDAKHPALRCADAARRVDDANVLQIALYACFEEIGSRIQFEGRTIVRTTALQELQQLPDSERRKRLFLAFSPLWVSVNENDAADSPYRRMLALNGADMHKSGRSPIGDAAATLDIAPLEVERWLVQVLEAWHARSGGPALEPWDYWYASARASRELSAAISRQSVLITAKRFYRELGADLDLLGVRHDLDVRGSNSHRAAHRQNLASGAHAGLRELRAGRIVRSQ